MTEARRKKFVYVALVAAIIYGAVNFWPSGKKEEAKQYRTIAPLAAQQGVLQRARQNGVLSIDFARLDSLPWGTDPFRADHKAKGSTKNRPLHTYDLTGIIYSPDYPLAVINHKTVSIGDKIDNARVVRIEKTKVILDHNGTELTLTVNRG